MKKAYIPESDTLTIPIGFTIVKSIGNIDKSYKKDKDGVIVYELIKNMLLDDVLYVVLTSMDEYHNDKGFLEVFKWSIKATDYLKGEITK